MSAQPRILFVDDEIFWLNAIRRIARHQKLDWILEFVESPKLALAMIAKEPWDAVVTDFNMPGMNGAEFLENVRRKRPEMAMLMLSSMDQEYCESQTRNVSVQFVSKNSSTNLVFNTLKFALLNKSLFGVDGLSALKACLAKLPGEAMLDYQISYESGRPIFHIECDEIGLHWECPIGTARQADREVLCEAR